MESRRLGLGVFGDKMSNEKRVIDKLYNELKTAKSKITKLEEQNRNLKFRICDEQDTAERIKEEAHREIVRLKKKVVK